MQHLPRDAELTRRFGDGEVERREHVLAQDRAGVDGLHLWGLLGGVFRYRRFLSGIARGLLGGRRHLPIQSEPPRAVDRERASRGLTLS